MDDANKRELISIIHEECVYSIDFLNSLSLARLRTKVFTLGVVARLVD